MPPKLSSRWKRERPPKRRKPFWRKRDELALRPFIRFHARAMGRRIGGGRIAHERLRGAPCRLRGRHQFLQAPWLEAAPARAKFRGDSDRRLSHRRQPPGRAGGRVRLARQPLPPGSRQFNPDVMKILLLGSDPTVFSQSSKTDGDTRTRLTESA